MIVYLYYLILIPYHNDKRYMKKLVSNTPNINKYSNHFRMLSLLSKLCNLFIYVYM